MQTKVKLRHWGSSIGVIIPSDIVRKENLKEGDEIIIEIKRKNSVKESFGMLRDWKVDSSKKEWVDVNV